MLIDGFGLNQYRSFGLEHQYVGPFRKINFFAGQNNSGKSNILRFIKFQYAPLLGAIRSKKIHAYNPDDGHIGSKEKTRVFSLAFPFDGERYNAFDHEAKTIKELVSKLLTFESLRKADKAGWLSFESVDQSVPFNISGALVESLINSDVLSHTQWQDLWGYFHDRRSSSDLRNVLIPESITKLAIFGLSEPKVELISAIRNVGPSGVEAKDFDGAGIIDRLARLQHPTLVDLAEKEKFKGIIRFLQNVTGNPSAEIEIPVDRSLIHVTMNDRTLAIQDLGTGIHEVVILAVAATVLSNQVICIEEPELHLHPILQRKLIRYLQLETDNQYFFTTHSAHLLDSPDSAVFHVRLEDGSTKVTKSSNDYERSLLCFDLGYVASDLLQANCVIWVEGPSDRIYIKHWINSIDSSLIEGIHFSIMFYGGRLLSHLTPKDPEVSQFISLSRLNRNIAIVIDSDKPKSRSQINATKARVVKELKEVGGFAWVTNGREIENYIETATILRAVQSIHRNARKLAKEGKFDQVLQYKTDSGKLVKEPDKVKIAHEIVKNPSNLNVLDLKKQMRSLVTFIKSSNLHQS